MRVPNCHIQGRSTHQDCLTTHQDESSIVQNLPEYWLPCNEESEYLVRELELEIHPDHALYGARVSPVAVDDDDVLFRVDGNPSYFALVHLTWSGHREFDVFPETKFLRKMSDFCEHHNDSGETTRRQKPQ